MRHRLKQLFVGVLFAAVVFVVHCRGTMGCADSMWSVPTAVSLYDHGDVNLDEYLPQVRARLNLFTEWHRGHVYTMFPFGTSILIAPAVPMMRMLAAAAIRGNQSRQLELEAWQETTGCHAVAGEPIVSLHSLTELVLASGIVALASAVIFFLAGEEGLSTMGALIAAAIFAFGTSAWSTASRSLWQHGPSMLILSVALVLQRRGRLLPLIGALLAFAYVIRPTNLIALIVGLVWAVIAHRRRAVSYASGAAIVLAAFIISNEHIFGAMLPPYFRPQRLGSPTFLEALAGDLVSPSRGLFVFSPVLAFAVFGIALKVRQREFSGLDAALTATILLHWISIASFPHWWGGHSFGPRFFTDMLPYFVFFLIPVVRWLETTRGVRRAVVATPFVTAAAFSIFVHAQGALVFDAVRWNVAPMSVDAHPERIWDWSDPQFLAGLKPR